MALRPHILHVVGYTEADHAATAEDVIESCKLARRSVENALGGPDMTQDDRIQTRVDELTREATSYPGGDPETGTHMGSLIL